MEKNYTMNWLTGKWIWSTLLMLISLSSINAQNIGISSNGATPDASAALDISSTNKGILIPRIELTSVLSASPISNPTASLLIYNTATAGSAPDNVVPGYYIWTGSNWNRIPSYNSSTNKIDDLRVFIDKGSNSAQLGSLTGISGPEIWFFRNEQGVEAMSFTVQLPHNWKEGTDIHPHIHWVPKSSGTGNVVWNLDYSWAELNESNPVTFPSVTTTSATVNGPFTANKHMISYLTTNDVGVSGTGKSKSSILICRLWRDSSLSGDTYQGDAGGLSIDFHITLADYFDDY